MPALRRSSGTAITRAFVHAGVGFFEHPAPTSRPPTRPAGEVIDQGRGRIFPCEKCGADLEFHIGQQTSSAPTAGTKR